MLIIKAIAGALVLASVIGTGYLLKEFTGSVNGVPSVSAEQREQRDLVLQQKAEQLMTTDNEPGEKAFKSAEELLAMGEIPAAEERLKYVVSNYPSAKCSTHARRILGELNVDRLLDPDVLEGKIQFVVKSGDTFIGIVRRYGTTMDSLVHHSRLMKADARSLRLGDQLTVMPLKMRVVVNDRLKTLTVFDGDEFVKEYPILKSSYNGKSNRKLKIDSIHGEYNGRRYLDQSDDYLFASKIITLSDKSLVIRALSDDIDDDFSFGFFLNPADMQELPLLIRSNNEIEIRR